jgi:hypothetical protein
VVGRIDALADPARELCDAVEVDRVECHTCCGAL